MRGLAADGMPDPGEPELRPEGLPAYQASVLQ
jgi:hypothetical protein